VYHFTQFLVTHEKSYKTKKLTDRLHRQSDEQQSKMVVGHWWDSITQLISTLPPFAKYNLVLAENN